MYPRRHNVLNLSVGPSVPSSVRPFVRYETCKHDILKTSEPRFDEYYHKGQKRSKVKEIIVLIKARSFLDELNLEHLTS